MSSEGKSSERKSMLLLAGDYGTFSNVGKYQPTDAEFEQRKHVGETLYLPTYLYLKTSAVVAKENRDKTHHYAPGFLYQNPITAGEPFELHVSITPRPQKLIKERAKEWITTAFTSILGGFFPDKDMLQNGYENSRIYFGYTPHSIDKSKNPVRQTNPLFIFYRQVVLEDGKEDKISDRQSYPLGIARAVLPLANVPEPFAQYYNGLLKTYRELRESNTVPYEPTSIDSITQ